MNSPAELMLPKGFASSELETSHLASSPAAAPIHLTLIPEALMIEDTDHDAAPLDEFGENGEYRTNRCRYESGE